MCEVVDISDDEDFPVPANDLSISPVKASLSCGLPPPSSCSKPSMENVGSSSGSTLRSSFIGMGFAPSLVDKAIEENGEENADILLEALFASSDHPQPKTEESLDDGLPKQSINDLTATRRVKEEPEAGSSSDNGKKASLLKMNFSLAEVEYAMRRLGEDASISKLMDFIFAMRMAEKYEKDTSSLNPGGDDSEKDCSNEALFGILEKTLELLEMGFTENEISTAFEKCGSEAPLPDLANSIVDPSYQYQPPKRKTRDHPLDSIHIKTEEYIKTEEPIDLPSQAGTSEPLERSKGKQTTGEPNHFKKPKEEFPEGSVGQTSHKARKLNSTPSSSGQGMTAFQRRVKQMEFFEDLKPTMSIPTNPVRNLKGAVARPPYFLYGNVTSLSQSSWVKITQFLYSVQPEFVSTEMYSALSRTEGYVHNLPTEDRFHVSPKGPMTIEEVTPRSMKWWPDWDDRKQLNCINSDINGVASLCDKVRKILSESNTPPPVDKQREFIQQFQAKNLVWVGRERLGPLDPEQIEQIMGYPTNHSRVAGVGVPERLKWLKQSFQTDTLGYYLSVLKGLYPEGVSVMSLFSGIGGAEVALQRLGIRMKCLVSVEASEVKRGVLKRWWESSGQRGELIQMENIHKLSNSKMEELMKRFRGFDLIVCQNPYSGEESNMLTGMDFSMFVEFVRVVQRIRSNR